MDFPDSRNEKNSMSVLIGVVFLLPIFFEFLSWLSRTGALC